MSTSGPDQLETACYGPGMLKQLLWHHLLIGISIAIIVNFGILGRYWVGVATAPQNVPFPISAFSCNLHSEIHHLLDDDI